jgi:hypothetical protein
METIIKMTVLAFCHLSRDIKNKECRQKLTNYFWLRNHPLTKGVSHCCKKRHPLTKGVSHYCKRHSPLTKDVSHYYKSEDFPPL